MLANDGGRVVSARSERRDDPRARRRIAESDRDVAQPAFVAGATQRRPFRALAPFVFRPTEELDEIGVVEAVSNSEVGDLGRSCELVPRAKELAIVATENAIADCGAQLRRDRA